MNPPLFYLVRSVVLPVFLGLVMAMTVVAGLALAKEGNVDIPVPAAEPFEAGQPDKVQATLEISYARVVTDHAPVYASPTDVEMKIAPTRLITPGFIYLTLESQQPISYNNQLWYQINPEEYVPAEYVRLEAPSEFHGIWLPEHPERPFGWIVRNTPLLSAPGAEPTDSTVYLPRYEQVTIYETIRLGDDEGWHRIGPEQWVELYDVGAVWLSKRPDEIGPDERWIEVDLYEQTLAAYEGERMIFATLVSTGLPSFPTVEALTRIKSKVQDAKMSGGGRIDYYYIENVQATMYFTQSYALHAAYWHDGFGKFKSHGCVNMSPTDAAWLFDWTTPVASPFENKTKASTENLGTWVWVHE